MRVVIVARRWGTPGARRRTIRKPTHWPGRTDAARRASNPILWREEDPRCLESPSKDEAPAPAARRALSALRPVAGAGSVPRARDGDAARRLRAVVYATVGAAGRRARGDDAGAETRLDLGRAGTSGRSAHLRTSRTYSCLAGGIPCIVARTDDRVAPAANHAPSSRAPSSTMASHRRTRVFVATFAPCSASQRRRGGCTAYKRLTAAGQSRHFALDERASVPSTRRGSTSSPRAEGRRRSRPRAVEARRDLLQRSCTCRRASSGRWETALASWFSMSGTSCIARWAPSSSRLSSCRRRAADIVIDCHSNWRKIDGLSGRIEHPAYLCAIAGPRNARFTKRKRVTRRRSTPLRLASGL